MFIMKTINIEKLKTGDKIMWFDLYQLKWIKCKVNQIEKYLVTLEDIEGILKGFIFYETLEALKDLRYYRSV